MFCSFENSLVGKYFGENIDLCFIPRAYRQIYSKKVGRWVLCCSSVAVVPDEGRGILELTTMSRLSECVA